MQTTKKNARKPLTEYKDSFGNTRINRHEDAKETRIAEIAKTHLYIDTLASRHSDRLDFHEMAVWTMRRALEAAYEAGLAAGRRRR